MAGSNVDVTLRLRNAREFDAAAKRSSRRIDDFGDRSGRASREADKLSKSSGRGRRGLLLMGRAARYGGIALGGFALVAGKKSVDAASNLNEQVAKSNVVFGSSAAGVQKWSKGMAMGFGVSRREALETAGTFGNMLVPMGASRKEAAAWSKKLVELGADLGSFNNVSNETAMGALSSGLAGESEPLRRLGVDIRDAALQEFALAQGIKRRTTEMSSAEKSQLIYRKILADTGDAQGDVKRTAGSWANVQKRLGAVTENLSARLGKGLIPYLKRGGTWLIKFIDGMNKGTGTGGRFRDVVTGIWQGVKPVALWFGRAARTVATFAAEHPKLVAFAAGLYGLKKAAGGLGGGLFRRAGLRGGSGFIGGFKGGMGQFFGAKFGEYMLSRYGPSFRRAGRSTGGELGNAAGPRAATNIGNGVVASSRGGRLRGSFMRAGGLLGPAMGAAIALPLLAELGKRLDTWQSGILSGLNSAAGGNKATGDALKNGPAGKLLDFLNPLDKGLVDIPGLASGGATRGVIPRGEDGLIGARHGEFMMQQPAVRRMGLPTMRALNEGAPLAAVGGGGGNRPVIHQHQHRIYLDGRELVNSTARVVSSQRARG